MKACEKTNYKSIKELSKEISIIFRKEATKRHELFNSCLLHAKTRLKERVVRNYEALIFLDDVLVKKFYSFKEKRI